MSKPGRIIILVAPSGSGKSTIAKRLINEFPIIRFSVSATTRAPRTGETDGVDYHFLNENEFLKRKESGDFLESEKFYNGTRYGTLKSDVENQLEKGYFVLLDIDVLGALNVKQMYGDDALSIFISPPSLQELEKRLRNRGTEDEKALSVRLERASKEMQYAGRFDLNVVNDNLDQAYNDVKAAVEPFLKPK
ncbi:MAG: guanylate kinase [Balneolaceae bacterium]